MHIPLATKLTARAAIGLFCFSAPFQLCAQIPPGAPPASPGGFQQGGFQPGGFQPGGQRPGFESGARSGPAAEFDVISNLRGLLARPEVQQEIALDLKQRNALTAMQEEASNAIRERVRIAMQGQDPQFRAMSPEQRRVWLMQQQQQLARAESAAQQTQGDLDAKTLQILRPEQITRLHELDLQKRGPMALGDPRVQQELKLSGQTRTTEATILNGYRNTLRMTVAEAMREATQRGDTRQGDLPDFTSRLSPLRKKIVAAREQAEKQALDALTDEEKEAWTTAQGKPFRFRADTPQTAPRQQLRSGGR